MQYIRSSLTILLLLCSLTTLADVAGALVPLTATSHNGLYRITVYPNLSDRPLGDFSAHEGADSQLNLCEAVLEKLGPNSYEFVWRKSLTNIRAPGVVVVRNNGHFVTLDSWPGSDGTSPDDIVMYGNDAAIIWQKSIFDVVGEEHYNQFRRSTNSVQWRDKDPFFTDEWLVVTVANRRAKQAPYNSSFLINPNTGELLTPPARQ